MLDSFTIPTSTMIRRCGSDDLDTVYGIINDASQAYRGIIPADRWKEPYMPMEELRQQISEAVEFWGEERDGELIGVMGIQSKGDVTLIRHAYVRTANRQQGVGGRLLTFLLSRCSTPVLIGTWADASWAVDFYRKHGFALVTPHTKDMLLRKYWTIPDRQVETSVVLADEKWFERNAGNCSTMAEGRVQKGSPSLHDQPVQRLWKEEH